MAVKRRFANAAIFILLLIVIALVTKFVPSVLPYDPYAQNLRPSWSC